VDAPMTRRLAVIAGTSACHLAVTSNEIPVPGVWGPYFEALMPETWLLEAGISASGAFLEHVLKSHPAHRCAGADVFGRVEATLLALGARGATEASLTHDLHFQPNLLGNRAPLAKPELAGGMAGWRLRDDDEDLARWYLAALQALAYATRHIVETVRARGVDVDVLIASGGSAASVRWCQTHADALGIPVVVPSEVDGVLLGSAMLAATAAGIHDNLTTAMEAMTAMGRVVAPNPAMSDFHDRKYRVYRRMLDDQLGYDAIMAG
jgi:ribulose kinase